MFEEKEAIDFIKSFLQISDVADLLTSDRLRLLNEMVYNIQTRLPFHNIALLSVPFDQRRRLTPEEAKSNFVSGLGGICFELNICTFHLLSAVGYDVILVRSSVTATTVHADNHLAVIARDVDKPGDRFLVDVGMVHPTFRPISLDFETESPVFVDSYLEYKYVKYNGQLLRMQRQGDPLAMRGVQENSDFEFWLGDWRRFYTADLDGTKDPSEFDGFNENVRTNPKATSLHRTLIVASFPGGRAASLVNGKTLTDKGDGKLEIKPIEGGDEGIISTIQKIYPVLPTDMVRKAVLHWSQFDAPESSYEKLLKLNA